ncbi:MAG: hypothetical protein NC548_11205 [Lachnospiraceae bacterium]|nr:hypothetical protein [Lachnospiraceae bacterium]
MKKRLLSLIFIICTLCITGCTVDANRIYTVCKSTESTSYVYNADGEFFMLTNGRLIPCSSNGLQTKPKLILIFDDSTDYNLVEEIPSVYSGTKDDCLHYVTRVLTELGGKYAIINVDWKSFEMLISTDDYDIRIIYTSDDKVRIYAQCDDEGVAPPFLNEK